MTATAPVLALDGPSGSGKGTVARKVAAALGWHLLDSGSLYRLLGMAAAQGDIALDAEADLARLAGELDVEFSSDARGNEQIRLNGADVSREIRTEDVGRLASAVAPLPAVRAALLDLQKSFREPPGLVADGRDMGTLVFPDAVLKVFLTASPDERARRRHKQLKDKGIDVSLSALSRDIEDRDRRDSERTVAPLRPADDALLLDSSKLTIDQVTRTVLEWLQQRIGTEE